MIPTTYVNSNIWKIYTTNVVCYNEVATWKKYLILFFDNLRIVHTSKSLIKDFDKGQLKLLRKLGQVSQFLSKLIKEPKSFGPLIERNWKNENFPISKKRDNWRTSFEWIQNWNSKSWRTFKKGFESLSKKFLEEISFCLVQISNSKWERKVPSSLPKSQESSETQESQKVLTWEIEEQSPTSSILFETLSKLF